MRPTVAYSCVIGTGPKAVYQLWLWLTMLLDEAGVSPADLHVHVVSDDRDDGARQACLRERGVAFTEVAPSADQSLANVIAPLANRALRERDYAVLLDAGIVAIAPLEPWVGIGAVCAKVVDFANPPIGVLEELYRSAGFARLPQRTPCGFDAAETFVNNVNGAVRIVRTDLFEPLRARWAHWLDWMTSDAHALGRALTHEAQIAFGLALHELDVAPVPLPAAANLPTYLSPELYDPRGEVPRVLRYYDRIASDGTILPAGADAVDGAIAVANARIARTPRPAAVERALRSMHAASN